MPISVATASDASDIVDLYNISPLATVMGTIDNANILANMARSGSRAVLNRANNGTLNACVIVFPDTSALDKQIYYQLVFGRTLVSIRPVLREIAQWGIDNNYTRWYCIVPQNPEFDSFRSYLEARWPYLNSDMVDTNWGTFRYMGDALQSVVDVG